MKVLSEIIIKSENEMKNIGGLISKLLKSNDLITFEGDLGVGKTFLCKSIINTITNIKEVPSPTFNLVQTYPLNKDIEIWHCDFYRIISPDEIDELGVFDNINNKIILIEWPKFLDNFSFNPLKIKIEFGNCVDERSLSFIFNENWKNRLKI